MAMKIRFKFLALVLGFSLLAISNVQAAASVTFYHHDALGSVIATSNQYGDLDLNEEYQPYGEKIYGTEDFSSGNEDWYTGKNYSKELDLTYFGARWYDAKQGRFLSIDPAPVVFDQVHSFNRYHYGNNNPYKYVDPDGNAPISVESDSDGDGIPNAVDDSGSGSAIQRIGNLGPRLLNGSDNRFGGGISATKSGTEAVQRAMSRDELQFLRGNGVLRFGRSDRTFVGDAVNTNANRARQRLALPRKPEVRVTVEVPAGRFSSPTTVKPLDLGNGKILPGGGFERSTTGVVPARIIQVDEF
jgi:RHS repeat-associated protein